MVKRFRMARTRPWGAGLIDRLQSAISMMGHQVEKIPSNQGVLSLLIDCLHLLDYQKTEINNAAAHRALLEKGGENVKHIDLTRYLAGKIRRQKDKINALSRELAAEQTARRLVVEHTQTLMTTKEAYDSHFALIKTAARNGDLLRVLALLEKWGME